jgi:3',5'-cyclic AMP phosphodiesterase CpdA
MNIFVNSTTLSTFFTIVLASGSYGATAEEPVVFFHISDTHYHADKENPSQLSEGVGNVACRRLIDVMNKLPGKKLADGTVVPKPRGVIVSGDLIDDCDKTGPLMPQIQQTEWNAWVADFGLTGVEGKLVFPVYELHGNHDNPHVGGPVQIGIAQRNRTGKRPDLVSVSANGLHYSWEWGRVHFINLGIIVGSDPAVMRQRRYDAQGSLQFLIADLKKNVGDSGKLVVLAHHIDVLRYARPCDPTAPFNSGHEWDPCDVAAYGAALKGYHVIAILFGHTHGSNFYQWNGIDCYNVGSTAHSLRSFEVTDSEVKMIDFHSPDHWQTWKTKTSSRPIAKEPAKSNL